DGPALGPRTQKILERHRADKRFPRQFVDPQPHAAPDGHFVEQAEDRSPGIRRVLDDADAINVIELSVAERQLVERSLHAMEARVAAEVGISLDRKSTR